MAGLEVISCFKLDRVLRVDAATVDGCCGKRVAGRALIHTEVMAERGGIIRAGC